MRRALAALGTGGILALVLIGSRGQPGGKDPPRPGKLPPAIGAIHPRLSPDGALGRVLLPGRDLDRARAAAAP